VTAHPRRADGEGSEVLIGVKGAFEEVVARCATVCTSAGDAVTLDAQAQARLTDIATELADQGMRIIACADRVDAELGDISSEGFARAGLRLLGLVAMVDPPRSEVRAAIEACRSAGISVKMITGDHVATAAAISHDVGISGAARAGSDIDRLDDDELAADIGEIGVFARSSPAHKMRIISALRARGEVVAMTGDGVNDAPALRAADIGVAMGRTGTEVAKEAADLVLATDDFTTIVGAVREGRVIFDNIVKFVRFQLATNIGALVTIMVAELIGMPTPFSPIQILWINLIMDGPPALALSVDPAASGVMARPPRPLGGQILPMRRLLRVAVVGGVMAAGTLGFFTLAQREWGTSVALTGAFSTFVLFQVVNALGVRDEHRSMFSRRSLTNPALWSALGLVVVLQVLVVEVPFAQDLFTTTSLSGVQWAAVVAAALLFLVVQQGFVVVVGRLERS
jgi:Ca2+-transporting ATPase